MKFKHALNKAIDAGITLVSAAAGGTVAAYTINHDLLNDEDLSMIVGSTAGVGTFMGTKAVLTEVKNGTGVVVNKAKKVFKANPKAKKDAVSD